MKKTITLAAAILAGCASNSPADNWQEYVTPKAGGINSATARGDNADQAKRSALLIARAACNAEPGKLVIIQEQHTYDGPTGTEQAVQTLSLIGLGLYNHNTGSRYSWSDPDQHYQTVLDFRCD